VVRRPKAHPDELIHERRRSGQALQAFKGYFERGWLAEEGEDEKWEEETCQGCSYYYKL
jgi:hypothetical protein